MNLIPTRWYIMFFMPSGVSVALIALGLFLAWRQLRRQPFETGRCRKALAIAASGLAILYFASTPWVAALLARSLERQTPFLRPEDAPLADAIMVLGGGQQGHVSEAGETHLFTKAAGDRFEIAVRAFKAGRAPILALGGGEFGLPDRPLVSDYMRRLAIERGVPPEAMLACGQALYTSDETARLAVQLKSLGVLHVLLCTSAIHMPRARLIVERLGFRVTPVPCDFETLGSAERFRWLMLVPRGQALAQTENSVKEWIGLLRETISPSPTEVTAPTSP